MVASQRLSPRVRRRRRRGRAPLRLTRRGRLVVTATVALTVAALVGTAIGVGRPDPVLTSAGGGPAAEGPPTVGRTGPGPTPATLEPPTTSPRSRPVAGSPAPTPPGGRLVAAPGVGPVRGSGPLVRYAVEVEPGAGVRLAAFTAAVEAILADPRGWGAGGAASFQRVGGASAAFAVTLAGPRTVDRLCAPLETQGSVSCFNGHGRVVINVRRWRAGAPSYAADLLGYRRYLISHEVGHALGRGHQAGCRDDGLAPVMMQQTLGLSGCRANPWPYPRAG